jgi:hypothetical protein
MAHFEPEYAGVIEIEYELNKINVFTKIDEEPYITGICNYTYFKLTFLSITTFSI